MALLPIGRSFSKAYRNRQPRKNRPEDECECLLFCECCPMLRGPQANKLSRRLKRRNFHLKATCKAGIPAGLASRRMAVNCLRCTPRVITRSLQDWGALNSEFIFGQRAF